MIIKGSEMVLPTTGAKVIDIDFAGFNIKGSQRGLVALAVLTKAGSVLSSEMLLAGISHRYHGKMLQEAMAVMAKFI